MQFNHMDHFLIFGALTPFNTHNTATQPFLSSDISTQSLLKSDGHLNKILLFCDTRLVGNYKRVTFNFWWHTLDSTVSDAYVYTRNGQLQVLTPKTFKTGNYIGLYHIFRTISKSEHKMDVRHNEMDKMWHARDAGVLKSWHSDSHTFLATLNPLYMYIGNIALHDCMSWCDHQHDHHHQRRQRATSQLALSFCFVFHRGNS